MEIETDKTTVGVPTPLSGVIEEIYVQDGDTVKAGQQLFKIKAGAVSDKPAAAAAEPPKPQPVPEAPKAAAPTPVSTPRKCAKIYILQFSHLFGPFGKLLLILINIISRCKAKMNNLLIIIIVIIQHRRQFNL